MRKLQSSVVLLITIIFLAGCMGMQAPDTPEKAYTVVRIEFNKIITGYLIEKSKQTDEIHAQWTKDVDPVIRNAESALDAWGLALDLQDMNATLESEQMFLDTKNKLIDMLTERGI